MNRLPLLTAFAALAACSSVGVAGDLPGTLNFQDVTASRVTTTIAETQTNEKDVDAGDFDNDGDLDVLLGVAQGDFGQRSNKLYRNDAGVFTEVTADLVPAFGTTDVTRKAMFMFIDDDPWLDIWVINDSNAGPQAGDDKLYISGFPDQMLFTNQAASRLPSVFTGAACSGDHADFDGDGDEDAYCGNYPNTSQDRMYFNDGSGDFTDVTLTHVPFDPHYTVDIACADMNGDGQLDLLIANDFDPNWIYYNNNQGLGGGTGNFRYNGSQQFLGTASVGENAMEPGDFDVDGDVDFYWSNRHSGGGDRIYRNDGNDEDNQAVFTELDPGTLPPSVTSVVTRKAEFADLNGDWRLDGFVGTWAGGDGRPIVLRNVTVNGVIEFIDWTPASAFPVGPQHDGWHGQLFDTNGDGDLDIFLGGRDGDHLFEQVPMPSLNETDLVGPDVPDLFDGEPIAILGSARKGESDDYRITDISGDSSFVSVVATGLADLQIDFVDDGGLILATIDRGGAGIEEAGQFDTTGMSAVRVRVTVIEAASGPHPADLVPDGEINAADLSALLQQWGKCADCPADFDGSGSVGPPDLSGLLQAWGPVRGSDASYQLELLARGG